MKILQVIPYFPPAYVFGGPVKVAYQISKELANRGHEVAVYTTDAKDFHSRIKMISDNTKGVKVQYFKNVSLVFVRKLKLFITPQLVSSARKEVKKFDLIHLHEYRTFQNIVIRHYAHKWKVPYILQAHGSIPRIGSWKKLKITYDVLFGYKLLKNASKVIALSPFEAEQYKAMGVPEDKIAIIPNGIDLSEYANLPPRGCFKRKFSILEEKKMILYLGRVHGTKGIDLLVKAYAYLIKRVGYKDTILAIVGPDAGYLNEAKTLTKTLNIEDSVIFTGFVSREDKLKALVDAEVFVTPMFYGFPITFLEACAVGVPIVTTSLGDELEWIDGRVGYVTQPKPQRLAEAIYKIISDKTLRKKFSENCVETIKFSFSIEKVVDRLEKLYDEVISERHNDCT